MNKKLLLSLCMSSVLSIGASAFAQAPAIATQPQSQTVIAGNAVTFFVGIADGNTLPTTTAGTLRLWLKADAGVVTNSSGQVSQWQDQSGNANHASQSTASLQPLLTSSALMNGKPVVRFDGVPNASLGDYMHGTGDVSISDAFTAFWVYDATSLPDPQICPWLVGVSGGTYGACRDDFIGANGQLYFSAWGNDYASGYNIPTNTARLWVDRLNTNKTLVEVSDVTANSRTNFSFNTSGLSAPAAGYYVGGLDPSIGSTGYPYRFAGDMAELIIYKGSLSDPDRTAVEQYLKAKYFTPSASGPYSYQWRVNGNNINNATNSSFTIAASQVPDAGTYDVVVCNSSACSTSSGASLAVYGNTCVAAPAGLIGFFAADGDAQDLTSTNRGTLSNVSFGSGVSGQAFQFSGNGVVTIPDSTTLRPASVSIVGWFMANSFNGIQNLVTKVAGTGTSESYVVDLDNGNLGAAIGDPSGIGNILEYPINPVPGKWYHFAFTFDNATRQEVLYLNGVALGSGLSGKSIGYDTHPLQIGAEFESQVLSYYLNGKVDEVGLFNRALTSNEVFAIYAAGTNSICKALTITTQPQSQTAASGQNVAFSVAAIGQQPLSYQWLFNGNPLGATNPVLAITNALNANTGTYSVVVSDNSGSGSITSSDATLVVLPNTCVAAPSGLIGFFAGDGDAQDLTSTNRGTLSNVSFGSGVSGQAFQFSGNGVVTVPDSTVLRPASISIVGWFMANSFSGIQNLVTKVAGTGTSESYVVDLDNGNLGAVIGDPSGVGNILEYPINPVAGKWYHFAFTFDDATKQQVLYLNGVALGSNLSGKPIGYDNHPLQIGAEFENQVVSYYLNGKIDEVGLFNRALSSNEVFAIYAAGTNSMCKALQITSQPQSVTVGAGTNATFTVAATGQEPLAYQWFFGATALGATNSSLTVTNAQQTDTGSYSVVVSDASGSVTSLAAVLAIGVAPSISTQPLSQSATAGAAVSFTVTASGTDPLGYQWRFNGATLAGATTSSLALTNVQASNAGTYMVVVTNSFGSATSSNATLTVSSPPVITQQPLSQTVFAGSNAVLSVTVPINSGTATLPATPSGTLRLWLRADAGVVTNASGQVSQWQDQSGNGLHASQSTSALQPLLVNSSLLNGQKAVRFDGNQTASLGDYLRSSGDVSIPDAFTAYMVYSTRAYPAVTVPILVGVPGGTYGACRANAFAEAANNEMEFSTWAYGYRTHFLVPTNTARLWVDRYDTNRTTIEMYDVSSTNNTKYSLATSGQSAPGAGYYVGGLDPTVGSTGYSYRFAGDLSEIIFYRGYLNDSDRVAVQQYLAAKYLLPQNAGPLTYQWQLNGVGIDGATNSTLTVTNAQLANAGTYDVVVCNPIGCTTSANATLAVVAVPSIYSQPQSVTVTQGAPASFTVGADGTAPLGYQWKKDGANLPGATTSTYTIASAQPQNIGNYSVVVTNSYGSVTSSSASLSIDGVPSSIWQGLIAYYPFNGDATDASGHGNNGNPTNVVFNTDRFGNTNASGDFSSGNAWVDVPTLNAMKYYPVTYSAWVNLKDYPTAAERRSDGFFVMTLVGRELSGSFYEGALCLYSPTGRGADRSVSYYTGSADVPGQRTLPTNQWVHIAFTIDASNYTTFYWNGQLLSSQQYTYPQNNVIPFRIGASAALTDYRLGWRGSIDDVRVYNRALSSSEVAQLFASEAPAADLVPSIQAQPQSVTEVVGMSATFSVTANGGQPLAYQWLLNNSSISGATNSAYTVANPQLSDDGSSFSVVVTNSYGSVTSAVAVLSVGLPPTISPQPADQTVAQGSPATFTANVSGTAPFSYQWSKDGKAIAGATDSTYTIANAQPVNIGSYSFMVTNAFGSATSSSANLSIQGVPSGIWQGLIAYYPFNGNASDVSGHGNDGTPTNVVFTTDRLGNANASADFSSGNAYVDIPTLSSAPYYPITYSAWIKLNSYPAPNEVRNDGWSEMTIVGRELTTHFAQGAVCLYSDPNGGLNNQIIYYTGQSGVVTSLVPPTNQWAQVIFTLDASNTATFYWNGQMILQQPFNLPQGDVIPFRIGASASFADNRLGWKGQIDDVRIYNRALSSNDVAQLYASEAPVAPSITQQPVSQSVVVGNPVTFTANGTGTPPLSYQWQHNGANVPGATTTSLSIASAQLADAGSYALVVSSPYGSATSASAVLSVIASTVIAPDASVAGGGTLVEPILLSALGNENALGFSLAFDPTVLNLSSVTIGSNATDGTLFFNTTHASNGVASIVVALPSGATFAAGTQQVAVVTFNVAPVAHSTVTPIAFGDNPTLREILDAADNDLPGTYVGGAISVAQTIFEGDVSPRPNGDQRVGTSDFVEVGRLVAGLDTPSSPGEFQRADCAPRDKLGDGKLTVSDWVQAGRYAVGLDPLTPVGGPTAPIGNAILSPRTPIARTLTIQTDPNNGITNVVSVLLNAQGDENAVGFSLSFDSAMVKFVGAVLGSGATGATMNVNTAQAANGTIGIALALPTSQSFAAGSQECVRLSFVPVAYSSGTSNLTFTDSPVIRDVSDTTANSLTANYVSSSLTVTGLVPSLAITQDGTGNFTLIWPAAASGFGLEVSSDVSTNWAPAAATVVTNGANASVTQPATGSPQFFRLHHP